MRIGITGASGQLGMGVVRHLLARVPASDIVAVTRTPDKIRNFASQGVTVRAGDFNDSTGLREAFDGIQRLLIIPASDLQPDVRPRQHKAAVAAALSARIGHLIYISSIGARPGPSDGILETHFVTEQALITSGAAWTLLRMSVYADMLVDAAKKAATSGTYSAPHGSVAAYVVRDDIAAAAAGLLASGGHEGASYHATGSAAITAPQIAEIVSKLMGTRVEFAGLTIEQFETGLKAAGLPPAIVGVISKFQRALQQGVFDLITGDIERLSGRRAESVEAFLARHLRQETAKSVSL